MAKRRDGQSRRAWLYERNFGEHAEWIRSLRCHACNRQGGSDPAHAKPRGMGGCGADRTMLLPLCRACHRAYDEHRLVLRNGKPFTQRDGIEAAAAYWARSPHNNDHGEDVEQW